MIFILSTAVPAEHNVIDKSQAGFRKAIQYHMHQGPIWTSQKKRIETTG